MALGTEYAYSEFTSDQDVTYKLSIYDSTSPAGASREFTVGGEGFVLTYKGIGADRYDPIKSSSVTFEMNIPSTSDDLYTIITSLQSGEQGRFKLKIERSINAGASYNDFWKGIIIPDIAVFEDTPFPSFYRFTATDGLSLMKDTPFDQDVYQTAADKDDPYTINNIIANMLRYYTGGHADFFTDAETYYREYSHWYEDSMQTPAFDVSPFHNTGTYPYAFVDIKYNDQGEIVEEKPQTAYQVLEGILKAWGCRIWQQDGYWWIAHVNMWDNLSGYNLWYRNVKRTGSILGSGASSEGDFNKEMGDVSQAHDITKIAGSTYSYLPEAKACEVVYDNWGSGGMLDTEQSLTEFAGANYAAALAQVEAALTSIGYVVNATNAAIYVKHRVLFSQTPGGAGSASWYDMLGLVYMLKIGTHYWNGDQWTTNQSVYFTPALSTPQQFAQQGGGLVVGLGSYPQVEFTTADLPASGELYYAVFKTQTLSNGVVSPIGANDQYAVTIKADQTAYPSSIYYTVSGNTNISRTFGSADATSTANTIIDLGKVPIGDGPTTGPPSWGRLRVYDGSDWLNTVEENWQAWETGTQARISQILTEQCFIGQRQFVPLNTYKLLLKDKVELNFGNSFDDNTDSANRMLANGWTLVASKDEISGEFWRSTRDATGITNTTVDNTYEQEQGGWWLLGM